MPRLPLHLLAALSVLAASGTAHAFGRLVDVRVVDRDTGRHLTVHTHQGRHYIAGRPGARYEISVRNRLGERLLTVVSVDGVNVVSGETAGWGQAGYVLSAWERYAVAGWRKSLDEIAAFEFTSLGDAYATRTGRPAHVGVIGVAAFREVRPLPPAATAPALPSARAAEESSASADTLAQSGSRAAPAPAAKLGTGHGQREHDSVGTTTFERARARPDEIITLHYDSRENLIALGIIPRRIERPDHRPQPFPESAQAGFVPDPPQR